MQSKKPKVLVKNNCKCCLMEHPTVREIQFSIMVQDYISVHYIFSNNICSLNNIFIEFMNTISVLETQLIPYEITVIALI